MFLGDYQFDVYRMIKEVHNDGHWDKYRPITNVIVSELTFFSLSGLGLEHFHTSGCIT